MTRPPLRTALAAAGLLFVGAVLAAGQILAPDNLAGDDASSRGPVTTTEPQETTSATPSPAPTAGAAGSRDAAVATARAYLTAFFERTGSEETWRAAVDEHATSTLDDFNATVPRNSVPTAQVRSVELTGFTPGFAEFEATLTGGLRLHGAVVYDAGTWLVDEVAPENAGDQGSTGTRA